MSSTAKMETRQFPSSLARKTVQRYPNARVSATSHSLTFQEVIWLGQPIDLLPRLSQLSLTVKAFLTKERRLFSQKCVHSTEHCPTPLIYPSNQD